MMNVLECLWFSVWGVGTLVVVGALIGTLWEFYNTSYNMHGRGHSMSYKKKEEEEKLDDLFSSKNTVKSLLSEEVVPESSPGLGLAPSAEMTLEINEQSSFESSCSTGASTISTNGIGCGNESKTTTTLLTPTPTTRLLSEVETTAEEDDKEKEASTSTEIYNSNDSDTTIVAPPHTHTLIVNNNDAAQAEEENANIEKQEANKKDDQETNLDVIMTPEQPRRRRKSLHDVVDSGNTTPNHTIVNATDGSGSTYTPAGVRRSARIARKRS